VDIFSRKKMCTFKFLKFSSWTLFAFSHFCWSDRISLGLGYIFSHWCSVGKKEIEFEFSSPFKIEEQQVFEVHFCSFGFLDAHASLYLLVPACLPAWPSARLTQLALSKDDIDAHPLRPMSHWLVDKRCKGITIIFKFCQKLEGSKIPSRVNRFFQKNSLQKIMGALK
jgi:hypothetical protein